ncbi:hypothetical protein Tco_1575358 [Tanacetum coccineum]
MFDVNVLYGEEVFVAEQEVAANKEYDEVNVVEEVAQVSTAGNVVSTAGDATTVSAATTTTATITNVDDITLAQALTEIKSIKPKDKGVVIEELGESIRTIYSQLSSQQLQDKGKWLLIELAKIDADHQLAKRLQAQEQEELSVKEKDTLFQQLLEKGRKHFAAKRVEEKRNKPPIKAQQRKILCTYLLKDLKFKDWWKAKKREQELIQESTKKQKVEDDKEIEELKQCLEIIPDEEEVTIDAIPLAVKSPSIVGWKIYKEGRKSYYQIMRANGKSQTFYVVEKKYPLAPLTLSMMLEKKLNIDYESEMAYQLLKFIIKQLKKMDDPNITMEEYIRLEEEKARKSGKVYNWETATYGKIWDYEDVHDLRSVETELPTIVFNDTLTSEAALSCEPTVSSLNDNEINFRISFDEFDDEDYTVIYDKNSFYYKIIYVNDLKTDSENDNEKVNMPSFPSPEPTVSCFDDLNFFKDFENEFPAIVYNDALTSKSDFLTEPTHSLYDLFAKRIQRIRHRTSLEKIDRYWWRIYKSRNLEVLES